MQKGIIPPISFKRRWLRWLIVGIGVISLLIIGYLAGVQWLFNSGWLQQRLSQLPGVTVTWSSANAPSFDRLDVRDLIIQRADENVSFFLEVDQARLHISWWSLLFRRLDIHSLEAEGLRALKVNEYRLAASAASRVRLDELVVNDESLGVDSLTLALEEAIVQRQGIHGAYQTLARNIRLQGEFVLETFHSAQTPGLEALAFLSGDVALAAQADAWDVFNPYLGGLDGVRLSGRGGLQGQIGIDKGVLQPGSELTLASPQLAVVLDEATLLAARDSRESARSRHYRLEGKGQVSARVDFQDEAREGIAATRMALVLEDMQMREPLDEPAGNEPPFLNSERFRLNVDLPQLNLTTPPRKPTTAALIWQGARLPDVAVLARFLPQTIPFDLHTGKAGLDGRLDYEEGLFRGSFDLRGDSVDLTLLDRRVTSELGLDLKLKEFEPDRRRLDLSGTRLRVSARNPGDSTPLETELLLRDARLSFTQPSRAKPSITTSSLLSGKVLVQGRAAELSFLNRFLPETHGLAMHGNGLMEAELIWQGETLLPGSRLWISADPLELRFLDYVASGNGRLDAKIEKASRNIDVRVSLPSFALRRQQEVGNHVSGRYLLVEATLPATVLNGTPPALADQVTRISLPQIDIPALSLYNAYLPKDAGIELLSGRATLAAYLNLQGYQSQGNLDLKAREATLRIGDQHLQGNLSLDAQLGDGDLERRQFDVSGSTLRLDNLSRQGEGLASDHDESGWWMELGIEEGQLVWAQPLNLDAQLTLRMRDSGFPLRTLLKEVRQRQWLSRLLNVQDIRGRARLQLVDQGLALRDARLTGQELEILAELVRRDATLDGALYARYAALGLGIEIDDGQSRLHLLRPRRWYEQARHLPAIEEWALQESMQGEPLQEAPALDGQAQEKPKKGEWYRALPLSPAVSSP
ncbi:hypothetical protein ACPF7Z_13440 [Halomonas sp. GXIMD04776]|uniref:hypothetical protein n=1 Tax=Halomonas sp. GXIMD04776 TaxID=3415605 RepID=UPI003C878B5B